MKHDDQSHLPPVALVNRAPVCAAQRRHSLETARAAYDALENQFFTVGNLRASLRLCNQIKRAARVLLEDGPRSEVQGPRSGIGNDPALRRKTNE